MYKHTDQELFVGIVRIHIKHKICPGKQEVRRCVKGGEVEENGGEIRSPALFGKMRKRMEMRERERKSEKSSAGHLSQRHKSRPSQLDSNANPPPSTQWKSQPQFSQVPMCVNYLPLSGTLYSPHCFSMNVCVYLCACTSYLNPEKNDRQISVMRCLRKNNSKIGRAHV